MTVIDTTAEIKPEKVFALGEAALAAWDSVESGEAVADVRALQARKRKSVVFRFELVTGRSVVAKCGVVGAVMREVAAYEVCQRIAEAAPRLVGTAHNPDDRRAWIFVEFLEGREPRSTDPLDLDAVAAWMARVHARGMPFGPGSLPALDVWSVIGSIESAMSAWSENREERVHVRQDVQRAVGALDEAGGVADRWHADVPKTLVHGSVRVKNLRVDPTSPVVARAFDWGAASWGWPARDVSKLARLGGRRTLDAYRSAARDLGFPLSEDATRGLVAAGELLRSAEHLARHLWSDATASTISVASTVVVDTSRMVQEGARHAADQL